MSILEQLASSVGSHSQQANVEVAQKCVAKPALLAEIVAGMTSKNARQAGDCAEVITKVGETHPKLIVPFAAALRPFLHHKNGRVRWESAHAYGLIAGLIPQTIEAELRALAEILGTDESIIVRDYVIDAVHNYGATSSLAAEKAYPILKQALGAWQTKQSARVLGALKALAPLLPARHNEMAKLAAVYKDHERTGVRKSASALARAVGDAARSTSTGQKANVAESKESKGHSRRG